MEHEKTQELFCYRLEMYIVILHNPTCPQTRILGNYLWTSFHKLKTFMTLVWLRTKKNSHSANVLFFWGCCDEIQCSQLCGTVWKRLSPVSTWQCPYAQKLKQRHKKQFYRVWCGRTWPGDTELWPQSQPAPLGLIGIPTASQASSSNIWGPPQSCSCGWMGNKSLKTGSKMLCKVFPEESRRLQPRYIVHGLGFKRSSITDVCCSGVHILFSRILLSKPC